MAFDLNTAYHHRSLLLGSVGFSKRYYTTEQLVYAYGRTEDIPLGQRAELIAGPEYGEYYNRFFTGARYERANYVMPIGYLSGGLVWGGFWRNQQLEDGMLQASIRGFSYLIYRRRTRFRLFLQATYTQGIRRQQTINLGERFVDVSDRNGIRGLRSRELEGNERLGFKFEAVMYPPFDLYSFRMAGFAFVDAGFIAPAGESIVDTKPYQGFGLGVRIRNENLAFKTLPSTCSRLPRCAGPEKRSLAFKSEAFRNRASKISEWADRRCFLLDELVIGERRPEKGKRRREKGKRRLEKGKRYWVLGIGPCLPGSGSPPGQVLGAGRRVLENQCATNG